MKDVPQSGELSQRLTAISSEYKKLKALDAEGDTPLSTVVEQGLILAAERCDVLAGQKTLHIGNEFRDALKAVQTSPEYETAYQWGYKGGSRSVVTRGAAEVRGFEQLIEQETGANLVHSSLAAAMVQPPQAESRYASPWRSIYENMNKADLSGNGRAIVTFKKLAGQGFYQLRKNIDKLHDPQVQLSHPNPEQFWQNKLCTEGKEGIAFYLGYTERLMKEARQLIEKMHPETDTNHVFELWSVICYLNAGDLSGKYHQAQSFRPDVFALLDQGNSKMAEAILYDVALVSPNAFSPRLLRYLSIDRKNIVQLRDEAQQNGSSELVDSYRGLSIEHRDALRRKQILQATKDRAELISPESVAAMSQAVGKFFYGVGRFGEEGPAEPYIYEITKMGNTTMEVNVVADDGTIRLERMSFPWVFYKYLKVFPSDISLTTFENGSTYPGRILRALEGKDPTIVLHELPLTREQLNDMINNKTSRREVYALIMSFFKDE